MRHVVKQTFTALALSFCLLLGSGHASLFAQASARPLAEITLRPLAWSSWNSF